MNKFDRWLAYKNSKLYRIHVNQTSDFQFSADFAEQKWENWQIWSLADVNFLILFINSLVILDLNNLLTKEESRLALSLKLSLSSCSLRLLGI